MQLKKTIKHVRAKYLPRVQYIIDAVNSCETLEQLVAAELWGKELLIQWAEWETRLVRNNFWRTVSDMIAVDDEFEKFRKMVNDAVQRKNKWKIDKPFLGIW